MNVATRNLLIFVIVTLASGWLGLGVDRLLGLPSSTQGTGGPGAGIWLVLPLITVVFLRFFGTGWKRTGFHPRLARGGPWYVVGALAFPVVTTITIGSGALLGVVDVSALHLGHLASVFGSVFVLSVLKNVFEESVWRGYLTEELLQRPLPDWALYLAVGLVWGLWHLPYYLGFMEEATLRQVLDVPPLAFAAIGTIVMICWSVAFTEIYRLSASIWPCVLMHSVEDALLNPLVLDGFVSMSTGAAVIFSPIAGLISAVAFVALGLGLRQVRRRRTRSRHAAQGLRDRLEVT